MKAFPTNIDISTGGDGFRTDYGMDLRDYFAAKALQLYVGNGNTEKDVVAKYSYELADAMMKERNKNAS